MDLMFRDESLACWICAAGLGAVTCEEGKVWVAYRIMGLSN